MKRQADICLTELLYYIELFVGHSVMQIMGVEVQLIYQIGHIGQLIIIGRVFGYLINLKILKSYHFFVIILF